MTDFPRSRDEWPAFFDKRCAELHKRRLGKLLLLAKHYDIKVVANPDENKMVVAFWGHLAMRLIA
jgi:hypothetical protein